MKFKVGGLRKRGIAPTREEYAHKQVARRRSPAWLQCCNQFESHSDVTAVTPQDVLIIRRGSRTFTAPRIHALRTEV